MTLTSQNKPDFLSRAKLISEEKKTEEKKPDFLSRSKLISAPEEEYMSDEEFENEILRNQAQQHSRALEGIFGLPGDLINFVGGLFGYEPNVPGHEKLREISEEYSGGYTKPKDEFEESAGELMQDISLFALPGAKHYSVARNLAIPVAANLVKEGIKYSSGSENQQGLGKIGSMIILDILSHRKGLGSAKEVASNLFKQADEAIPKGLSINASNLEKSLNTLEKTLKLGGDKPSTTDALHKISELKDLIKNGNGKVDLKNLVSYRPAINEWIDKYKGFDIAVPPSLKNKIVGNLNKVKGEVIKAAEEYGEKYNPEYLKLSQNANEAYSAWAQSNKIKNFLEKKVGSKLQSTAAKALLGIGLTAPSALGGTVGVGATALGGLGYKMLKTILRSKSPTLRNHYFNILEGAAKGNSAQVIKNAKLLDKELLDMDITGEINLDSDENQE